MYIGVRQKIGTKKYTYKKNTLGKVRVKRVYRYGKYKS